MEHPFLLIPKMSMKIIQLNKNSEFLETRSSETYAAIFLAARRIGFVAIMGVALRH
jgi:hypothetical protein